MYHGGGYEFVCTSEDWYVFKVEFIIGDTCTVLSVELIIESTLGKTVEKMEYRTRLLETVEDFFCQPNFNDSYF